MDLEGSVRTITRTALGGAKRLLRMTGYESLGVTQVEDKYLELSRAGKRFYGGNSIIANGIAPVAAIPTTTAALGLFNPSSHNSLVITQIGFWLGSGTAAAGATLFGTVSRTSDPNLPLGPNATGYTTGSSLGPNGPAPQAFFATAASLASTTVWCQIMSTLQVAAANVGQGDLISIEDGYLIVPPRGCLGMSILSGAGTNPLYGISVRWAELNLDLAF